MALKIEGVVDRGMHAEEALGRSVPGSAPESMTLLLFSFGIRSLEHLVPGAAPLSSQRRRAPAGHHRPVPNRPIEYDASHPVRNHQRFSALSNLHKTVSRQRRCRDKSP
jgi:hypothetical protein